MARLTRRGAGTLQGPYGDADAGRREVHSGAGASRRIRTSDNRLLNMSSVLVIVQTRKRCRDHLRSMITKMAMDHQIA
eukprot:6881105-Pyramimonas_sp.AAC.2